MPMRDAVAAITQRTRVMGFTTLIAFLFLLSGCSMKDEPKEPALPRFTQLEAFRPHRESFECKHEAAVNPRISPEAETVFQQAQALTGYDIWPEKRNYVKSAALYERAMKLGHWKAQFNLAGLYLQGRGVPQDVEKAIQLTEDLMRKGVPAAWDNMGAYYMGGLGGLKQDATVAYAFWQKAADMGSMAAQTYIGAKLIATHDEPPSFWSNLPIGLKMLECAFAQDSAEGAYQLGGALNGGDKSLGEDYAQALQVLHRGVKLGSEKSANTLFVAFDDGKDLVNRIKDRSRAERYMVLANALYSNPDLRFPNLDKVLPLPPARLPMWDGKDETLINAAKAVVPTPAPAPPSVPNPASQRSGRAHIPEGQTLPARPQVEVLAQFETTRAPETGYWIARLMYPITEQQQAWNSSQLPMRYEADELFDRSRPGLRPEDGRIQFHYLGQPVAAASMPDAVHEHPLVSRGIARYGDMPDPPQQCKGNSTCPETGIWVASVPEDHPLAAVFNHWHRQAYVERGQAFPNPKAQHLDIDARAVIWRYWAQANEVRGVDLTYISVDLPSAIATANQTDDGEDLPASV
jgi:uncharacterized protein